MKLVFATHNKNKFNEVKTLLPPGIELVSLTDIKCFDEIPETATTIKGNAMLKVAFVKKHFGLDCFADDTGLEVTALNNEPGVYSARYAGENANATTNIDKLLQNLQGVSNRSARFKTVIALSFKGINITFEGICIGSITQTRQGEKGFGYDPVFLPDSSTKTFAQMSQHEKNIIGHRGIAMRQLISYFS